MATDNSMFFTIFVLYTVFFGFLGLEDVGITHTAGNSTWNESDTPVPPGSGLEDSNLWTEFVDYVERIFSTIQGFPTIANIIIFTPLFGIAVFWLIKFIIDVLPFVGN